MHHHDIPGTVIFDGEQAKKGYALNKMCYSFNSKAARDEFVKDDVQDIGAQQTGMTVEAFKEKLAAAGR